ncbi:DUF1015 family protein [Mycoplasmopsis primatum]|uniref:DUF1015 family protein n=1 Tax=Mycoplasmopsis primatum TaxID=55604 RepID=UPI00049858E9|nr:DUF1015 family protein [Mycoplasmopsis primatum]
MKISTIKNSYVNVSGNVYEPNFINLTYIKNNKIAFDFRTLFLSEEKKSELNSEPIEKNIDTLYIFKNNNSYGILADLDINEYRENNIKSHELIYPNIIQGMASNLNLYNTEANPVFILYDKNIDLLSFIENKLYFKKYSYNNDIEIYAFNKDSAKQILKNFEDISQMYVADGHHRLYVNSFFNWKPTVFGCFMSFDQVCILPIHRMLKNVDATNFEIAKNFIHRFLSIKENKNWKKNQIKITYQNQSFIVGLKENKEEMLWNSDVYKVNTQIITTAFRIQNSDNISFINDWELDKVKKYMSNNDVLIEIKPISVDEFKNTALNNGIFPPKSTCFVPKFPSFLVFKKYK